MTALIKFIAQLAWSKMTSRLMRLIKKGHVTMSLNLRNEFQQEQYYQKHTETQDKPALF